MKRIILFLLICFCAFVYAQEIEIEPEAEAEQEVEVEGETEIDVDTPVKIKTAPITEYEDISDHSSFETEYFRIYNEGWTLQPYLAYKSFNLVIKNNISGRNISYDPSTSTNIGLRGVYKGYGGSFSVAIPEPEDPITGETTYVDLQFMLPLKTQGFDFIYQQYTGFHIKDKALKVGNKFLQYPDLLTWKFAINYYYVFNHDFSLKAGFNQTARQLKSAGSWMILGSLNLFAMANNGSVIPLLYAGDFTTIAGLSSMWFTGIGISGGYAHTFTDGEWFLTMALFIGTNSETQSFTLASGTYEQNAPFNPKTNLKISGGKQTDDMYFGASLLLDNTSAAAADIQVDANSFNFTFFWGWRL